MTHTNRQVGELPTLDPLPPDLGNHTQTEREPFRGCDVGAAWGWLFGAAFLAVPLLLCTLWVRDARESARRAERAVGASAAGVRAVHCDAPGQAGDRQVITIERTAERLLVRCLSITNWRTPERNR